MIVIKKIAINTQKINENKIKYITIKKQPNTK
jgi:hypothetical protein